MRQITFISLSIISFLLLLCSCSNMQIGNKSFKEYYEEESVYLPVDVMPQFPGGDIKLHQWITENVKYPEEALKQKKQGRAVVLFVIDSLGVIHDPIIKTSAGELLDQEALRVVNAMPNWIPARKNGKAVSVDYNLPIIFTLPAKYR